MKRPIMIDVDGVLAEFCGAFSALACRLDPAVDRIEYHSDQRAWEFDGISLATRCTCWTYIDANPAWWLDLEPLASAQAVFDLREWAKEERRQLVIVTARHSNRVDDVTIQWLRRMYAWSPPILHVPSFVSKLDVARGLNVSHAIDDSPEVLRVLSRQPRIRTYAPDYKYCRGIDRVRYLTRGFDQFVTQLTGGVE